MSDKSFIAGHLLVSSGIYTMPQNEWDRWGGGLITYRPTGEKFYVAFPNEVFDDTGFNIIQVTSHAVGDNIHVIMYLQLEPFYGADPISAIRFIYPKSGLSVSPPNGDDEYPVFKGDYIPYDKPILESIVSEGYGLPSNLGIYPCAGGVYQLLRDVNDEPRVVTCRYDAKSNLIVTKMNQFDSSMDTQGVADYDTVAHAVHGGYGALPMEPQQPEEPDVPPPPGTTPFTVTVYVRVLGGFFNISAVNAREDHEKITVDWGDGTIDSTPKSTQSHSFNRSGRFTVKIYGGTGVQLRCGSIMLETVEDWGDYGIISYVFGGYGTNSDKSTALVSVPNTIPPYVIYTTDMFRNCLSFMGPDISGWDVSRIIGMERMFEECYYFNNDLSGWDVSNVESWGNFDLKANAWNESNKPKFG